MLLLNHDRQISHDRLINYHHYRQRAPTPRRPKPVNDQSVEQLLS